MGLSVLITLPLYIAARFAELRIHSSMVGSGSKVDFQSASASSWKLSASSCIQSIVLNRVVLLDDCREDVGTVAVKTDYTYDDPGPD